ncbi:MAG TPA: hypothetical protein V6D14_13570 [Coleofasciculaceae cyanobacterium]|jgi:hypothetical protein
MPYRERLNSWVLVRLLPNMQQVTVGQYRNRSDADGHLEIIRRLMPNAEFVVMFNPDLPQPKQGDICPRTRTSGR